ncbi:MAG: class III poly(R)-hydroxyalkanoic acid synthase subunit PhaC [Planctomycetes bacterium]|nr:class III poly(R)-hydroxyalkanoic acid synthase subunit PhaC [Planctomycetota bacterium]
MPWLPAPADAQAMWDGFLRRLAHLPKVADVARKVRVGATPKEVVHRIDKLRLLHYLNDETPRFETPLLVVFALVNRPYILDLRPGKSVVSHFIQGGFNTYNLDWGVPSDGDRFLDMNDYINGYLDDMVDEVRQRCGVEQINLLGYCMGGSMSAMYTALHPHKVRNLIMLAAPVDWSSKDYLLGKWVDPGVFDVDQLIEVYGNAPADLLQGSFLMLKPVSTLVEKYFSFYENMENEKFLEDFFAMETWLNDNIPVAGEMFRQFVKYCMQQNRLIKGTLRIGGKPVNLRNVTCPVLNLTAQQDHLVPCGLSTPFNDAVGSADRTAINFPAGHIGLAVGSKANRDLWPRAVAWLAERSKPLTERTIDQPGRRA